MRELSSFASSAASAAANWLAVPLVGGGQILAEPLQEAGDGAVFGQGIESPLEVALIAKHGGIDLSLQHLDQPLAVEYCGRILSPPVSRAGRRSDATV